MGTALEDLRVLQQAEALADGMWKDVIRWDVFARDTVGKQLVRAGDSVGANIAEAFGRFHYGEKLHFLYFARGSLYETKYWLNRALNRSLLPSSTVQQYTTQLTDLARQLNAFADNIKRQRTGNTEPGILREPGPEYLIFVTGSDTPLFTEDEYYWLETSILDETDLQSLIPNLQSLS